MRRLFKKTKSALRQVRHRRIRAKLRGSAEQPRLSVFRGLRSISLQLVDDNKGVTICSAHSKEAVSEKNSEAKGRKGKEAIAYLTGELLAKRASEKEIKEVIFDRAGYKYHGRIKAAADGARNGGLIF